jgi:hypothetical protein
MKCGVCGNNPTQLLAGRATKSPVISKFGGCRKCFLSTIVGLPIAILLIIPSLVVDLPAELAWIRLLPTGFLSVWLVLHVIGYFLNGAGRSLGWRASGGREEQILDAGTTGRES